MAACTFRVLPEAPGANYSPPSEERRMKVQRVTPVLVVDAIEPVIEFWVDRLGFQKTTEVPHEDKLGFVILERDGVEIMYQSRASVAADVAPLAQPPQRGTFLFITVDDLDSVARALKGVTPVIP